MSLKEIGEVIGASTNFGELMNIILVEIEREQNHSPCELIGPRTLLE